ncbi:peptidoglycan DD-metalloendopeptidase family protein [Patescibacteria group bacterium]
MCLALLYLQFVSAAEAPALHLPFFEGETWSCDQGNGGSYSHTGSLYYAWDFNWGSGSDDLGKPVAAPADGVVTFASWKGGGWGNVVTIDYDGGDDAFGRLAHFDTILVSVGEHVRASQVIGLCGGSGGYSPHIHYQTEDHTGNSFPSSFIECGVPVAGGHYLSQNSQVYADAFNRNGGADNMGQPQNSIHWYYAYEPQMTYPTCFVQDFNGGNFGWSGIVYDGLSGAHRAYVIRTGFWGTWRTLGSGGPASPLGQVISDEYPYRGTSRQDFVFGYMVWSSGQADIIYYSDIGSTSPGYGSAGYTQAFIDYYNDHGGGENFDRATGKFTGNPGVQDWGDFQIQYFEGGDHGDCAIIFDPTGRNPERISHVIRGSFFHEYMDRWYPGSMGEFIGPPSSDPFSQGRSVQQNFQDGYHMREEAGQVRVYAGNGAYVNPGDLYIPDAVDVHDESSHSCDPAFHLSWPVPAETNDFYLQVATDPDFHHVEWEGWLNSASGDKAYSGAGGKTYYGRVRRQAANGVVSGYGGRSDGIMVGCAVPCHDEGVFSADPVVHFSYPVPADIDLAHMQIASDPDFSGVVWESDIPPTGDRAFSGSNGNTYYARVKLQEGGHWGVYGQSSDGITIGMTFPTGDEGDLSVDPCFHVFIDYVPGMARAYFQIATDTTFSSGSVVWEGLTTFLDKAYNGAYGQTYYGRGKILDEGGHWTGYGAPSDGITVGRTCGSWDDGDTSTDPNFVINYETVLGTSQVTMQVARNPEFTDIFWEGIIPHTGGKAFNGTMGETYYGRVKVEEGGHWGYFGEPSDGITLGLTTNAWDDGDYSADNETVFHLDVLPGFEEMNIQIATDPDFQNIIVDDTGLWNEYYFSTLNDRDYYARVRGREGSQWGEFSSPTDGILIAANSWTTDEGEVSEDRMIEFDFDSYIGVTNAYCQVSRDESFADIIWEGWTNNVTGKFRINGLPGDYLYARMALRDNHKQVCSLGVPSDGIFIERPGYPLQPVELQMRPPLQAPRLIYNGSFEKGMNHWLTEFHAGQAQFFIAPGAIHKDLMAKVSYSEPTDHAWQIQLKQTGFPLRAGREYQVKFHARADIDRTIRVVACQEEEPWGDYGLAESIILDTDWREFTLPFTATDSTESNSRLSFFLGGSQPATIWLDQVRMERL